MSITLNIWSYINEPSQLRERNNYEHWICRRWKPSEVPKNNRRTGASLSPARLLLLSPLGATEGCHCGITPETVLGGYNIFSPLWVDSLLPAQHRQQLTRCCALLGAPEPGASSAMWAEIQEGCSHTHTHTQTHTPQNTFPAAEQQETTSCWLNQRKRFFPGFYRFKWALCYWCQGAQVGTGNIFI